MRILVDSRIRAGDDGGIEQCCIGLASGLSQIDMGDSECIFVTLPGHSAWLRPYASGKVTVIESPSVVSRAESLKSRLGVLRPWLGKIGRAFGATKAGAMLAEPAEAETVLPGLNFDVWHTLHPYMAVRSKRPVVLTIHDLQHKHLPQAFSVSAIRWLDKFYKQAVQAATSVTTVSEFCAHDIATHFEEASQKLHVVRWAAPLMCYAKDAADQTISVLKQYGISVPFALFPSVTYFHKNHFRLIEAARLLRDSGRPIHVVCTGKQKHVWPDILNKIQAWDLQNVVTFTGFIPANHLRVLFETAQALIFPSLFEGAGLGLVEAMNAGLPIACSDIPAFREYAGSAATFFDPTNPEAIADSLYSIMTDRRLRFRMVRNMELQRLRTWEEVAQNYMQIYKNAMSSASINNLGRSEIPL